MNLKAAAKYQIKDSLKSIGIFYLVTVLVIAFFGLMTIANPSSVLESGGSVEWSAMIFLFILGLNSFKEPFLMMLQNSTSRKTMFITRLMATGVISVAMAVINRVVVVLVRVISNASERFDTGGLYEMLYEQRVATLGGFQLHLEAILAMAVLYAAAIIAGYFITAAYYRMNKLWKMVVSIGVPVTLFVLLPLLEDTVLDGKISAAIQRMIAALGPPNPYRLILVCLLLTGAGTALSWLLVRKAVEKG